MDIDLNIDNYNLVDLLSLFKLDYDFTVENLRQAKKIVMRTHPDRSGLDKEYFLFFFSAYKIVYSIHQFRERQDSRTEYTVEKDEEKEALLNKLSTNPNFNKVFNEMFEKYRIEDDSELGYGDWLQSDEGIDTTETTKSNMHEAFENKKRALKALVVKKDIEEMGGDGHYTLGGDRPESYGSSVFSSLPYEDVKKAFVESVIPVTKEDYDNRTTFKNTQDLRYHRDTQDIKPLSLSQANAYLNERKGMEQKADVGRAFRLAKEDEAVRKANDAFMSGFKQITNS